MKYPASTLWVFNHKMSHTERHIPSTPITRGLYPSFTMAEADKGLPYLGIRWPQRIIPIQPHGKCGIDVRDMTASQLLFLLAGSCCETLGGYTWFRATFNEDERMFPHHQTGEFKSVSQVPWVMLDQSLIDLDKISSYIVRHCFLRGQILHLRACLRILFFPHTRITLNSWSCVSTRRHEFCDNVHATLMATYAAPGEKLLFSREVGLGTRCKL